MDKIIFFDNDDQRIDRCTGQVYFEFLDYAFEETDYFMLVYVNYYGKGYSKQTKIIRKALESFKVKSRTNPSWPGTLRIECPNTTYKIVFYKNSDEAKEVLKSVTQMSSWSRPSYPEDLAFYKGNKCWFFSVGHEKIAAIIHANEKDMDFVESRGLALRNNASDHKDDYFELFDEDLPTSKEWIS